MPVSFPATTGLKFDWEYPDPPEIVYRLAVLESYLEDTTALAAAAQQVLQVDMAEKFEDEAGAEGPWAPLVMPAVEQVGILRLTTDMYEAAISDSAWDVSPLGVSFDTSVLPQYWVFHEQPAGGTQRIPRREFIAPTLDAQNEIMAIAGGWLEMALDTVTGGQQLGFTSEFSSAIGLPGVQRQGVKFGSMVGGHFRQQVRGPGGRFVSTRPEFYGS